MFNCEDGDVFYVDLEIECINGDFICVNCVMIGVCIDFLDGGLVVVVFELVEVVGVGVIFDVFDILMLFGED